MGLLLLRSTHGQVTGPSPQAAAAMSAAAPSTTSVDSTLPATLQAGTDYKFTVSITNTTTTPPALIATSDLLLDHTKILHMVLIGADLDAFHHIHPEDFGYTTDKASSMGASSMDASSNNTTLPFQLRFPLAGDYIAGFDAEAIGGAISTSLRYSVAGDPAMAAAPPANLTLSRTVQSFKTAVANGVLPWISLAALQGAALSADEAARLVPLTGDEYVIDLAMPAGLTAGVAANFTITVTHGSDGSPVTDMTLWLGAQAHIAVVKDDLTYIEHAHAMGNMPMGAAPTGDMAMGGVSTGGMQMRGTQTAIGSTTLPAAMEMWGPDTTGKLTLPKGTFRLIFQMSRADGNIFVPFDVDVVSPSTSNEVDRAPTSAGTVTSVALALQLPPLLPNALLVVLVWGLFMF